MEYYFSFLQSIPSPAKDILIGVLIVWSLAWKGTALWHASQNREKYWFIAILILNTAGILEIIYLFFFAKKKLKLKWSEIKNFRLTR